MSQTNNEVFAILKSYNDSISPRRLILLEEATANPALNTKWLSNFNLIRSFILARWGGEETPCTFARTQQAVAALHKGSAGLFWVDGKAPGMARDTEKRKDNVQNTQADIIQRQTEDRQRKIDETTLANAQGRAANYDVQPHSVKFDRRKRFLAVFNRLKNSGISAEEVSKGVDLAILDTEKGASAETVFRTVDEFISGIKNPQAKAAARRVIGV
jgi:hypothetical protein